MGKLRWVFEHEPALTLAVLGAVAVLISKLFGVDFTAAELVTALGVVLGVGAGTRQLVRPEHRARSQIVAAYKIGRADETHGFVHPDPPDVIRRASVIGKAAQSGKVVVDARDPAQPEAADDWSDWPNMPPEGDAGVDDRTTS